MIIVFVGLRKGNCRKGRNVATVLRAMIKPHNRLKGTKVFACGFSGRNLKFFFKVCREEPVLGSFYCIVAAPNVLKKITWATLSKKRRLHGDSYTITFCKF